MVAEILIIPDDGALESAKAGAQYLARGLAAIGVRVRESVSVCPDRQKLQQAVSAALERSNIIITLGGLGAESDFLAKNVIARGLGLGLELRRDCLNAIRAYCERTGEGFSDGDERLAELPEGSQAFCPAYGKIPGCAISSASQHIIMLPEPQQELAAMFNRYVTPYLSGNEASSTVTHFIRTYGVREEFVKEKLAELTAAANPAVTVQKDRNEAIIRVSAHSEKGRDASALCVPVLREIVRRMGDLAYGIDVDSIQSAAAGKMKKKNLGIAIAEAGTGGMLTRVIGETDGGQEILRYSTAADGDEAKIKKLGASPALLKKRGGVSEYAAVAMANGAREKSGTDIGVGISANVGDFSDKKSKPGLVYIAVCGMDNVYVKKLVVGDGTDVDITIDAAISRSLNMIRLFVDYLPDCYHGCIRLEQALGGRTVTDKDSYDELAGETEKPSLGARILDNFIIRKADEPKDKVRKFVFVLALLVFLGCAGYLGLYYYQSQSFLNETKQLQEMYRNPGTDAEVSPDFPAGFVRDFGALWTVNHDIAGYISIEGTKVDYPVVQAKDNEYYLRRSFEGKQNNHGIPFLDYRVDIARPSDNMVVYGHNMKDGQIFGETLAYKKAEYYKEHPIINYDTLYDQGQYKIFAVFITNADPSQGDVFDYHDFIDAQSDEDFDNYVHQLKIRSLIDTDVDVAAGDKLLTLSTCTYEFNEARFVICARKLRDGEAPMAGVESAKLNPEPLYPDIWYKQFGGGKPDISADARIVTQASERHSLPESSRSQPDSSLISSGVSVSMISASETASMSSVESRYDESKAAADKSASEKAASEAEVSRVAAEKSEADRIAAEKAEADRIAAEKAEADRIAAEKAEADRIAAEKATVISAQEEIAANAASDAAKAEKTAAKAAKTALSAEFADQAESEMEKAWNAVQSAREYADKAAKAADKADTNAARKSADAAKASADAADESFVTAENAAQALRDEETGGSYAENSDNGGGQSADTLTVYSGGKTVTGDALDIVSRIVQSELGVGFHSEAVKAQAVAAYTYILYHNNNGNKPSVTLASKADSKIKDTVSQVIGEAVYYKNAVAFTPYFSTSAGSTTSSAAVWGGSYPYLVSVDSSIESSVKNFLVATKMSGSSVEKLISSKLGIKVSGDPGEWFEVLTMADGGYNGDMSVCGKTKSSSGTKITGRIIREQVLSLRSACFDVEYDDGSDMFTFTTYGYGHGVGLSQNGANLYASKEGWSYIDILEHYYPGTTVK